MAFLTLTPENPDFCCSPLFSLGRVSNRLRAVVNREGLPVASEAGAHTRGSRTVAAVAVGVDGHFETLGQLFPLSLPLSSIAHKKKSIKSFLQVQLPLKNVVRTLAFDPRVKHFPLLEPGPPPGIETKTVVW